MKFNSKKIMNVSLLAFSSVLFISHTHASCSVSSTNRTITITVPSISLFENGEASSQFESGMSCEGFSAAFANMTYLKYRVEQMSNTFKNSQTGEQLYANLYDTDNGAISSGLEKDMSRFSLLNFFSGPNGSLPFYYQLPAGQNVSPGIYDTDVPFRIRWYYSVPAFAAAGLGFFFESPKFKRGALGIGFRWGDGVESVQTLRIRVLPDCRILAQNVNFGTAAFAGQFEPIQTSMGIRCSINTPYIVSLNNGLYPQDGNQRSMKSQSSNDFMKYEIYKNATSERWGSGSESWSSLNATTNPGIHDAITQQGYVFTTKVLDSNSDNLPAGIYQDTVTVEVSF
ncbi:Csu type fimbrial protein [Acinetobacter sp. ESBL14]|uniref:Csu type fimbrial protein n=1 Tax=Acinetobacter sp. ESBL14 TaxID=3077329 RepID=UPI002FC5E173